MSYTELDLTLHTAGVDIVADLRLCNPGGVIATLASNIPTSFDPQAFITLRLDPEAYGKELTAQLFAAPLLREAWARAEGYAQGSSAGVRLRLSIMPGAKALHELRWETLCHPRTHFPIARSERVLFSRFLDTPELPPITPPVLAQQNALVVIASPSDLEQFSLVPIDVAGELARTTSALQNLPATCLTSRPSGTGVTLNALMDGPRARAHGTRCLCARGRTSTPVAGTRIARSPLAPAAPSLL